MINEINNIKDIKDMCMMFNNKMNDMNRRIFVLFTILMMVLGFIAILIVYVYLENGDDRYHFYMNTKRSLEEIHGVKLDKYDGSIVRDLSTEEQLIRKSHERWHLRKVFK